MKRVLYLALGLSALFAACGDDSSTSVADDPVPSSVESSSSKNHESSSSEKSSSAEKSSSSKEVLSSSSILDKLSSSVESTDESSSSNEELPGSSESKPFDGTLTDSRDGQVYKAVKIGDQIWMAENLKYKTDRSSCYNKLDSNCVKYGRLYLWSDAMDSAATWSTNGRGCGNNKSCIPYGTVRGICPSGWHLPSKQEFETLISAVGDSVTAVKKLKSTSGWKLKASNGTDDYGFSMLPAGMGKNMGGMTFFTDWEYDLEGEYASFWTAADFNSTSAYSAYTSDYDGIFHVAWIAKISGRSVRCVMDDPSVTPQSSSSETSLLDWNLPMESYFNAGVVYDSITDSRDNKVYKTVQIGNQVWMAENLNYADSAKTPSLKGNSWCFDYDDKKCDVAGRFYTWSAFIDSVKLATDAQNPHECGHSKKCDLTGNVQGICPEGWHVPVQAEFDTLIAYVGGTKDASTKLKSRIGWAPDKNGTDDFGFSAMPVGSRYSTGFFGGDGSFAYFWSLAERNTFNAYYLFFQRNVEQVFMSFGEKYLALPVRCVKD